MRTRLPIALLLASCAHAWEPIELSALPSLADDPEASEVHLLDEVVVRFHEDPDSGEVVADVTERFRERVLRDDGGRPPSVTVHHGSFLELLEFRARVVAQDGTEREYDRSNARDAFDTSGGILYSDSRSLELELPVRAGGVVEWEHTTRRREPRLSSFGQAFGASAPVRHARLVVIAPAGFEVEWLALGADGPFEWPPRREADDDEVRLTWERRDLPRVKGERFGRPVGAEVDRVSVRLLRWTREGRDVSAFADARALSAFHHDLAGGPGEVTPELRDVVARALAGCPDDPTEKARRLYDWVQREVSYCAIEIGYGGWRPERAADVLRDRYGDCKGKANLLRALLAAVDVPSRLAVLFAHDGVPRPFRLPTLSNFNHMILIVDLPAGPVFADPTSRAVPFGELPLGDQEAEILPLAPGGADLARTPPSSADANALQTTLGLAVDAAGDARGTFELSARGSYAAELRASLLSAPAGQHARTLARGLGFGRASLEGLSFTALSPAEGPAFSVRGSLSVPGLARPAGTTRAVRLADLAESWVPALPDGDRRGPVVFPARTTRRQVIRIQLPEGERLAGPPPVVDLQAPFAAYSQEVRPVAGGLEIVRSYTLRERTIGPERYPELRAFLEAILAAEARAALVERT